MRLRIKNALNKMINATEEWIIRSMDAIDDYFTKWSARRHEQRLIYMYKKLTVYCIDSSGPELKEKLVRVEGFDESNVVAQRWVNKYPYGSAWVVDGWHYLEEHEKEKRALRRKTRIAKKMHRLNKSIKRNGSKNNYPKYISIRYGNG